jgi:pyridoxine 5-phosphate synthase
MPRLGVNVDHIASLRQLRGGREPDPVQAAVLAELAGAHSITAHLREDRRHMQDRDVYLLKQVVTTTMNLAMAPTGDMVNLAVDVLPTMVTLVPERRDDRGGDGGLTVRGNEDELEKLISTLQDNNILVCLFIDPDVQHIKAAKRIGATHVELNTGRYANAAGAKIAEELDLLDQAADAAHKFELHVHASCGLHYRNVQPVAHIEHIEEVTIGHAIIARAALTGLENAVRDMLAQL